MFSLLLGVPLGMGLLCHVETLHFEEPPVPFCILNNRGIVLSIFCPRQQQCSKPVLGMRAAAHPLGSAFMGFGAGGPHLGLLHLFP